jgi:hypothetical protein
MALESSQGKKVRAIGYFCGPFVAEGIAVVDGRGWNFQPTAFSAAPLISGDALTLRCPIGLNFSVIGQTPSERVRQRALC